MNARGRNLCPCRTGRHGDWRNISTLGWKICMSWVGNGKAAGGCRTPRRFANAKRSGKYRDEWLYAQGSVPDGPILEPATGCRRPGDGAAFFNVREVQPGSTLTFLWTVKRHECRAPRRITANRKPWACLASLLLAAVFSGRQGCRPLRQAGCLTLQGRPDGPILEPATSCRRPGDGAAFFNVREVQPGSTLTFLWTVKRHKCRAPRRITANRKPWACFASLLLAAVFSGRQGCRPLRQAGCLTLQPVCRLLCK